MRSPREKKCQEVLRLLVPIFVTAHLPRERRAKQQHDDVIRVGC